MPRTPRLDHPGARHHVMNRTLRKEALFTTDRVCSLFMDTIAELPRLYGVRIHGYVLMPNHYHLLVETPSGNLSKAMKHFGASLTQHVNRLRGLDGPVFRGRFKNRLVEDDAYWMHLLAYLHLNPVAAHLVGAPEQWLWSSHEAYIGQCLTPDWLTTSDLLAAFGSPKALIQYMSEVQQRRRTGPVGFDADRLWVPSTTQIEPRESRRQIRSIDQAIDQVASLLKVKRSELLKLPSKPGGNAQAWLAIWWARRSTGLTQVEVGKPWGLSRSRVGQVNKALMRRAQTDEHVNAWMDELEGTL